MAEELIVTSTARDDHQLDLTIELGPERTQQALEQLACLGNSAEVAILTMVHGRSEQDAHADLRHPEEAELRHLRLQHRHRDGRRRLREVRQRTCVNDRRAGGNSRHRNGNVSCVRREVQRR